MVSSSKLVIFRIYPSQTFSFVHFRHIALSWSFWANLMTVLCSSSQFGLISEFVTGPIFPSNVHSKLPSALYILQLGRRKSKATLMSKGKRRGGLSGVSKFVLESMKPTSSNTTSDLSKEGLSSEQNRPAKRRKGNNSVPVIDQTEPAPLKWVEKYDATDRKSVV